MLTLWAHCVIVILRMKIRVEGKPPDPPFFLVSNHLSYIDIIPLYRYIKCSFITQKGVGSWPVIGPMAKTMGLIFIDRSRKMDVARVNELISDHLHDHQGIVLFPEGTTSDGKELLSFRPSLLQHPAVSDFPVHYCSITYRTSADDPHPSESVCWWGGISFVNHFFKLAGNKKIYCILTFANDTVHETDRKKLAEKLHQKISNQFKPVSKLPKEQVN